MWLCVFWGSFPRQPKHNRNRHSLFSLLVRLLEMLENCTWGHGGYHVLPVHMDATAWLNMSRPRTQTQLPALLCRVWSVDLVVFHQGLFPSERVTELIVSV